MPDPIEHSYSGPAVTAACLSKAVLNETKSFSARCARYVHFSEGDGDNQGAAKAFRGGTAVLKSSVCAETFTKACGSATKRNSESVEMNALNLAQTIADADETTFGKLIVWRSTPSHFPHSKSQVTGVAESPNGSVAAAAISESEPALSYAAGLGRRGPTRK